MINKDMINVIDDKTKDAITKLVNDEVNSPAHYMMFPEHNLEVIDIRDRAIIRNNLVPLDASDYSNVLKYLLRCGQKGSYLKDLKKARVYLDRIIQRNEVLGD